MKPIRTIPGYRPLTYVPDGILLAKGYELYAANLDCSQLSRIGAVPHGLGAGVMRGSRLLERIFRLGVRFGCRIADAGYLLAEKNRIWLLHLPSGVVRLDHVVENGSRPLHISQIRGVDGFEDCSCYGEYWDNLPREPINIWVRSQHGVWRIAHTFPKGSIEHVHGIVPDERRGLVWILTGDFGDAPGIWAARNDFAEVLPVFVGGQDSRCCWLAFCDEQIIYATDSPLTTNSVRRLVIPQRDLVSKDPGTGAYSEPIMEISGSSIYACTVQDQVIFSTTVEPGMLTGNKLRDWLDRRPGPGIKGRHADLMLGTPRRGFSTAGRWMKDQWPPRLCEFGSISFPTGLNHGPYLHAYFTALSHADGVMQVFEIE